MSAFVLDLVTLPKGASPWEEVCEVSELGLPPADWTGRVRGSFGVERNGEQISVRGALEGAATLECVRCLGRFERAVRVPFQVFADRASAARRSEEEALERDDYMKFHDGLRLDLREEAREALLLELPIAPRCREDCRGLCPKCGADLNLGPCGCGT